MALFYLSSSGEKASPRISRTTSVFRYLTAVPIFFRGSGITPSCSIFLKLAKLIPSIEAAVCWSINFGKTSGITVPCSARYFNCAMISRSSGMDKTPRSASGRSSFAKSSTVVLRITCAIFSYLLWLYRCEMPLSPYGLLKRAGVFRFRINKKINIKSADEEVVSDLLTLA